MGAKKNEIAIPHVGRRGCTVRRLDILVEFWEIFVDTIEDGRPGNEVERVLEVNLEDCELIRLAIFLNEILKDMVGRFRASPRTQANLPSEKGEFEPPP